MDGDNGDNTINTDTIDTRTDEKAAWKDCEPRERPPKRAKQSKHDQQDAQDGGVPWRTGGQTGKGGQGKGEPQDVGAYRIVDKNNLDKNDPQWFDYKGRRRICGHYIRRGAI